MTTAAAVGLVVAASTGTLAWHRRLSLRTRTALVLVTVLLLVAAFLGAAADPDRSVVDRMQVRGPLSVRQALGWLLLGWLAAAGGGPLAEIVLRMASGRRFLQALRAGGWRRAPVGGQEDAQVVDRALEDDQVAAAQDLRGGALIGVLERLAVAGALLTGASQGLALVVAVKALGRYPELRTAGASERFIIGTLASLLWAAAAAGTGLLLFS